MQNNSFPPEKYPLIIQVIDHLLVIYSPDFNYRVAEPYRPADIGQTEMMILKVRREIASKIHHFKAVDLDIPSPTRGKNLIPEIKDDLLTIKEVSRLLGFSQDTIRRCGELKFEMTPGGHRRYKRADVEKYKSATSKNSSPPQCTTPYTSDDSRSLPSHLYPFERPQEIKTETKSVTIYKSPTSRSQKNDLSDFDFNESMEEI